MKNPRFAKRLCICTAAVMAFSALTVTAPQSPHAWLSPASVSAYNAIGSPVSHNFTTQGLNDSNFDISGNLSTAKGIMTYNGQTLTQCLKMETETSIRFETTVGGTLSLAIKDGDTVYIDEVKTAISTSGITTVSLGAGAHSIRKGSGTSNLFYIDIQTTGGSVGTTPTSTTTQTSATTMTTWNGGNSASVGDIKLVTAGGWNEMLFAVLSGVSDSQITGVSYSGAASGTLTGEDLQYLVRDTDKGARIDIPGLPSGTYTLSVATAKGNVSVDGISVGAQDRSGYAHFNYTAGVGAYNDNGTLKTNAVVVYVTNDNKNTVTLKSKDGTTVTGIGNILNSVGQDAGGGKTSGGGTANSNAGIIKKIAQDGTPLVIRILGNVTAPNGLTAYDSVDYGGSVGDNGFMARIRSGKDITIEGIGSDAVMNGWGIHFIAESSGKDFGKSFEVRNLKFRNVPEDCIGMEGVQSDTELTAPVERCWVHNNEFYKPTIANPAESDKDGGDGACDFKRGMYFTNSYNYYEGYHKTNLVGASDSNMQYHITFHHNYWKDCESRGPLARQANIHMYNNVFEGQTSYCQNPRADAYIFSEYNVFNNCKNPQQIKQGAIKSFHDVLNNCRGDMQATVVSSKTQLVSSANKYGDFDTNASLSYIPSGKYLLQTDTSKLLSDFAAMGGTLDDSAVSGTLKADVTTTTTTTTTNTTTTTTTTMTTTTTTESEPQTNIYLGDATCDGVIDISDVILICRVGAEDSTAEITLQGKRNGDCNRDGKLNGSDASLVLQFIAQLISTFE